MRAKYFTHNKSYFPVPHTSLEFANVNFIQPLRVAFTREEEGEFVQATSEGGDVTEVTFVDDRLVAVAVAKAQPPQE